MKAVPDEEVLKVLRDRYEFDMKTMSLVNERDPRYNDLFREFIADVQSEVDAGADIEDALTSEIETPLVWLGLNPSGSDADGDLIANLKADVNINIVVPDDEEDPD